MSGASWRGCILACHEEVCPGQRVVRQHSSPFLSSSPLLKCERIRNSNAEVSPLKSARCLICVPERRPAPPCSSPSPLSRLYSISFRTPLSESAKGIKSQQRVLRPWEVIRTHRSFHSRNENSLIFDGLVQFIHARQEPSLSLNVMHTVIKDGPPSLA